MNESIELEKFNQEKLKNFNLNRISAGSKSSRESNPDNSEVFKPTSHEMNNDDDRTDNGVEREMTDGVDDYDNTSMQNRKGISINPKRSSFGGKEHQFEAV